MTQNGIYLQKRNKLITPAKGKYDNKILVIALLQNIKELGYTLSLKLAERLVTLSSTQLSTIYKDMVSELKAIRGAHVRFSPMYPNFPEEVEITDATTLIWDALKYEKDKFDLPNREVLLRPTLDELVKLDTIELGSLKDFQEIFSNLLSAKTSISQTDKDIIKWFLKSYPTNFKTILPESIPLRENVAFLIGEVLLLTGNTNGVERYLKTPTDILRLCTVISGGDVSLALPSKFKSMSRAFRRGILNSLNGFKNLPAEMVKYKENWKRLGERLHPREFQNKYPEVANAFSKLRSGDKIVTFQGNVEAAIKCGDTKQAVKLLKTRPGEFARRLDKLTRMTKDWEQVMVAEEFLEVAGEVAVPVLLQVYSHFKSRAGKAERTVFPKGSMAKMQVISMPKDEIKSEFSEALAGDIRKEIVKILAKRKPLGNVFVDPSLDKLIVPFAERSASKAMRSLVRGSKIALDGDYDTIRFFLWWKQKNTQSEDIDLSACILDANWEYLTDLSYYNLRGDMGCHSGDIRSAPLGASEFIDISLQKTLETGGRYVVMAVFSYTGTPLCELPECFGGWMGREKSKSGEIYEPKTVKNRIDVTVPTRACVPFVIDALNREIIWTDIPIEVNPASSLVRTSSKVSRIGKALANTSKTTLGELFDMHVEARGTRTDRESADIVIAADGDVSPFEQDKIISEWL